MAIFPISMPYDEVTVIDQSQYTEETTVSESETTPVGPILYCPFVSPRGFGEDNKLTYMTSAKLAKYGTPNLKKYGLSLYLARRFSEAGGNVLGMRVMPDNAMKSNAMMYAKITSDEDALAIKVVDYIDDDGSAIRQEYPIFTLYSYNNDGTPLSNIQSYTNTTYSTIYSSSEKTIFTQTIDAPSGVTEEDEPTGDGWKSSSTDSSLRYIILEPDSDSNLFTVLDESIASHKSGTENEIINKSDSAYEDFAVVYNDEPSTENVLFMASIDGKYVICRATKKHSDTLTKNYYEIVPFVTSFTRAYLDIEYNRLENFVVGTSGYSDEKFYNEIVKLDESAKVLLYDEASDSVYDYTDGDKTPITSLSDGEVVYVPMIFISSKALGEFANAFRFNIETDTAMNQAIAASTNRANLSNKNGFFYKFVDYEGSTNLDQKMTFTFNDFYVYNNESMFVEDVVEEYSKYIDFKSLGANVLRVLFYNLFEISSDDFYKIDILFGSNEDSTRYSFSGFKTVVDEDDPDTTLIYTLTNGTDGWDNTSFTFDNDKFASEIAKAYDGTKTQLIYDDVRYPFEYIFAPSYNESVVSAIHGLVTANDFVTAEYFGPMSETHNDARLDINNLIGDSVLSNSNSKNAWKERIVDSWAMIRDPYTLRKVYMPSVYFDCPGYVTHWISNKSSAFAGAKNYAWTGYIPGTLMPTMYNRTELIANHNNGMNTMIEDGSGSASAYNQITAQQGLGINSALSEINNSIILCNMIRLAKELAYSYRWTTNIDVTEYANAVSTKISNNLKGCYEYLSVVAERESVNGAGRNRIRCKLNVVFNSLLKGVSYEFYILANVE